MPQKNDHQDMLGKFFATLFSFAWKMFLWALWACLRGTELITGGLATWLKGSLTK